jgi:O-antigen/teichoic acid export membrane protein
MAARLAGGVLTAGLTVFLARRLGSSGFGVFSLGLSIGSLLFLVSDFGVIQAVSRLVAENRHDQSAVADLLGDGIRLKLVGSLFVGAVLVALAGVIAHAYGSPRLAPTLRLTALVLVGMNVLLLCVGVFTALRNQALTLTAFFMESAIEVTASIVLVLALGGPAAATLGRAIGYLGGAVVALALTRRLVGSSALASILRPHRHLRRIAGDAGALLIVDGAYVLFTQVDSLLIGAFLTVTLVGIWQAPLRLIALMVYPGQAIASAVGPRLVGSRDHPPEPEAFLGSVRMLVIVMAAATAVSTAWADPVIQIVLGPSFRTSAGVLRALAPCVFLSGLGPLVSLGMNYLGQARRRIPIAVATVLLNLAIDLVLIPRIGVLGGAVGTDIALAIYVPAHFLYCQRALDLPLEPTVLTLVRSLLAAVAMGVVMALVGTSHLGAPAIAVGAVLGTAVFAAVLLISREVTPRELRSLWSAVRRRRVN